MRSVVVPSRSAVSRTFPPTTSSVPAARRFVREQLAAGGLLTWRDEAELAVSELATNAVLHAGTRFEVTVQVGDGGVYVQVWDDDPSLPARRASDPGSTTGRGMELVAAVATTSGVRTVGPTKVVWFALGAARPDLPEDVLLDRWGDLADESTSAPADPPAAAVRVLLVGMPVRLWLHAREHHNALMREYALHQAAAPDGDDRVLLVAADRARSLVLSTVRDRTDEPAADLALDVVPAQAAWFVALRDVLDRAEELARAGALLAPPGPQPVLDVRRWACGQVLDQLDGAPPRPWTGPLDLPEHPAAG